MKNLLKLSSIAIILAITFASCEGPEGPAGMNASAECMTCHNDGTNFDAKVDQFNASAHSLGTYFSRDGECSGCHSTEGFLARQDFTAMSEIYDLALTNQSAIGCKTCHTVHTAYDETDWALTFSDQVTETIFGTLSPEHASYSFNDYGNGNICLQCHQARDKENIPSVTSTAAVTVSTHWGPHYGVQGNVLHASGGVAITGASSYPSATGGHAAISDACISCHMDNGDHTLAVGYDGCITCHTAGDAEDKVDAIKTEVGGLLHNLGKELALAGVMVPEVEGTDTVSFYPTGGYGGTDITADQARAVYNYMVVYQDHSHGVHNPSYIRALLNNTLAAL